MKTLSKIFENIAKLIDVKSIITLSLLYIFCKTSMIGTIPQELNAVFLIVIGFYFGTQSQKKKEDGANDTTIK